MNRASEKIRRDILAFNRLEHFKAEKDMALVLGADHPRRIEIRNSANQIIEQINKIKK